MVCNNLFILLFLDEVIVKNCTGIKLSFDASLKPPFYIIDENNELQNRISIQLEKDSTTILFVQFVPFLSTEKECVLVQDEMKLDYHDHPKVVSV